LKAQASTGHSLRLASLAVQVRTATAGHFSQLVDDIQKMMNALNDEAAADKAKKNDCRSENNKLDAEIGVAGRLTDTIAALSAKMARLQKQWEFGMKDKENLDTEIKTNEDATTSMVKQNAERVTKFVKDTAEDKASLKLLEGAKKAVVEYYKMSHEGFAQPALVQHAQVLGISDDAPDPSLKKITRSASEVELILGLFDFISGGVQNGMDKRHKREMEDRADFVDSKTLADKVVKELKTRRTNLVGELADIQEANVTNQGKLDDLILDKKGKNDHKAEIKPDCDWILGAFDKRATARAQEMHGMEQAKAFLSGQTALISTGVSEGRKAAKHVETNAKSSDGVLAKIRFLGMQ